MRDNEDMAKLTKSSFIILACLIFFFVLSFPTLAEETRIDLDFRKQTVSAKIRQAPLRAIIEKIKREKGIWFKLWFKGKEALLKESISVQFKSLPIPRGLERIFSRLNYSLVFDQDGKLLGVILLGKPKRTITTNRKRVLRHRQSRRRYRRR